MLSDLLFVLNGVTPIFAVVIIGYFLKKTGFFTEEFTKVADKLVFKILLPCFLYKKVADMNRDDFHTEDIGVVLYALAAVLVVCLGTFFISGFFIKDSAQKGAFVQGVYRSNTAILGVPFAENLFGAQGARVTAILLAFVVPLYNILAVIVLSICNPENGKNGEKLSKRIPAVLKDIAKNRLILGIFLGLIVCFADITLPSAAQKTVDYLSGASTPLALLAIGANFDFSDMKGRVKMGLCASVLKTMAVPALVCGVAILLGFQNAHIGALFSVFGTPAAVSSYIMAKNMNNDYKLASQILILTTLLSAFTIALGSFILFQFGVVSR